MRYVVGLSNSQLVKDAGSFFESQKFTFTSINFNNIYSEYGDHFYLLKGYGGNDIFYSLEGKKTDNVVILIADSVFEAADKIRVFKDINARVILYVSSDIIPSSIPGTVQVASSVYALSKCVLGQ